MSYKVGPHANPVLILFFLLLVAGCADEDDESSAAAQPEKPPIRGSITLEPVEPLESTPGLEIARRYTEEFYAGDLEPLYDRFSEEFKGDFPFEKLQELHAFVVDQLGREIAVIGEDSQSDDEYRAYVRWARFSDYEGVIQIEWILREDDSIAGLMIQPAKRRPGS